MEPINKEGEVNESLQWIKDPKPLPEEDAEAKELCEMLEITLNKIPSIYRIALSLVDIQELNYMEAASVMDVSIGTVKSRLTRGRMQFRRVMMEMDTIDNSKPALLIGPALVLLPGQSK